MGLARWCRVPTETTACPHHPGREALATQTDRSSIGGLGNPAGGVLGIGGLTGGVATGAGIPLVSSGRGTTPESNQEPSPARSQVKNAALRRLYVSERPPDLRREPVSVRAQVPNAAPRRRDVQTSADRLRLTSPLHLVDSDQARQVRRANAGTPPPKPRLLARSLRVPTFSPYLRWTIASIAAVGSWSD